VISTGGTSTPETVITAAWRSESVRLIAALVRMTRDVSLAEDLAQDALVAALEQWTRNGIPANPGAWLMAVAKRRAIDHFRQSETQRRRLADLGHSLQENRMPDLDAQVDYIEDDVLRLMFLTCHPVLTPESRAALTLRLVGGLTTEEIAAAFLVRDSAMGQRISRAKRTLAEFRATIDLPSGRERRERLDDVLAVIYLIFNEGYAATTGADWMRPDLCTEALRLARMLAALVPDDPEVHGLQALLELQASRTHARTGPEGEAILLEEQDRARWDQLLIRRGLAALSRAEGLGRPVGVYSLQAAIAACHAQARTAAETDWQRIAAIYDVLAEMAPNPVVEVNRAVAHGRAYGAEAGLAILAPLADNSMLAGSHLLPSVRADLLALAGRSADAAQEFRQAAALSRNERERTLLLQRAERLC
jgi:RNA polymerase sigma factor (sigma-70 family)